MIRKVKAGIHTEKITNEPFDDIIGHSENERVYFTIENNDIIYQRMRNELSINHLPYLGPCVDFGMGDICLEEGTSVFKFYCIDRMEKYEYQEFDNINDAIKHLVSVYGEWEMVDDPDKMKEIIFQTLGLSKEKRHKFS